VQGEPTLGAFSFWVGDDPPRLEPYEAHWREVFPDFRVLGEEDVLGLLETHFPQHIDLYRSIRIPTARSDVARYLGLYERGGLYVDCHMGIQDAGAVRRLLASLDRWEAIFFVRSLALPFKRPPDGRPLITCMIYTRPRLQVLLDVTRQMLSNLAWHQKREAEHGFVPYHLYPLVGPGLLSATIFQPGSGLRDLRWDLEDRVRVIREEDAPMQRNVFKYLYATDTNHWSLRQEGELLFQH
jgi:hypothetical protein